MNLQQIRKELIGKVVKGVLLLEKPVYRIRSFRRKKGAFLDFTSLMKCISFISLLFLSTSCSLHVMNSHVQIHVCIDRGGIAELVTPLSQRWKIN